MSELQSKSLCFWYHQQFFKEHDDKLIQKNMKVFKKKLYVLKRKQNSVVSSNDNSSDLLISEINVNTIFSALSDDFWMNLDVEESFSASAESFQDVQ